jgi:hypothetical protein
MSIRSRTYLKGKFETGDVPTQADFYDWLESFLHISEDLVNDLTTGGTSKALSAQQGVELKGLIDAIGPSPVINTIYLSKSGSDSNNGSPQEPLLTLTKAVNQAGDGDTIFILDGTYSDNLIIYDNIRIMGYSGAPDWGSLDPLVPNLTGHIIVSGDVATVHFYAVNITQLTFDPPYGEIFPVHQIEMCQIGTLNNDSTNVVSLDCGISNYNGDVSGSLTGRQSKIQNIVMTGTAIASLAFCDIFGDISGTSGNAMTFSHCAVTRFLNNKTDISNITFDNSILDKPLTIWSSTSPTAFPTFSIKGSMYLMLVIENADALTLNTTPVSLLPSAGSGFRFWDIISAYAILDHGSAAFGGGTKLQITTGTGNVLLESSTSFIQNGADVWEKMVNKGGGMVNNGTIEVTADADLTLGTGSEIRVLFFVQQISAFS